MNRKLVLVMTLTLLVGVLNVAFNVQRAKASGTIYIRANGLVQGTDKIASADNITYTFIDNINDSIVVERSNIIIDGNGYMLLGPGYVGLNLTSVYNVTIQNANIENFDYGIVLSCSSNSTLSGNNLANNDQYGISLSRSSNNSIAGNNITNNYNYGIDLWQSSNNSISGNNITNSSDYGILLEFSSNYNSIAENNIKNNRNGIYLYDSSNYNSIRLNVFLNCGLVVSNSYSNIVTGNVVNGKPLVYLENVSEFTVEDAGQVVLVYCTRIRVQNLNLSNTTVGVQLWGTSNTTIVGNSITNNDLYGIGLSWSSNNNIAGNNITANAAMYGSIYLYESSKNNIVGNSITNNSVGIYLEISSNNSIVGNSITNNDCGIGLISSSNYNSISGNSITNNDCGIGLLWSSNNVVYHNNFINNTQQVYIETPGYANSWDDGYPSGGNYWSDYAGVDSDNDGIGDSWHEIDGNNIDHYPLMGMFSEFNATSEYCVRIICNSSISDFEFNGTAISFDVTGENDTTGFCRICIPTALMNIAYRVFVNGTEVSYNLLPCSNSTHSYLYFNYTHSTQEVIIIPEFPSFLILPLFMIATLPAIIVCKKKRIGISQIFHTDL